MKAIVYDTYGPPEVLQIKEVEKPMPKENEVLVKVFATSVTRYDCWARSCKAHTGLGFFMKLWFGLKKPKKQILGTEFAGEIEAIGKEVKRLKPREQVFGASGVNVGAYAEYISLQDKFVVPKPTNSTYEEAAAILQGALTALVFLRRANIKKGQKILIIGASGGVGMYAVQLAKHYFSAHVTGVCSTSKIKMVQSIGADKVIDYTREDFTKSGQTYDIIFDTFAQSSFSSSKVLKKRGAFLFATYGLSQLMHILWLTLATRKKAISPLVKETTEDLNFIRELIEAGKLKPVIDKTFSMNEIVRAHKYVEEGNKKGNVVISIQGSKEAC